MTAPEIPPTGPAGTETIAAVMLQSASLWEQEAKRAGTEWVRDNMLARAATCYALATPEATPPARDPLREAAEATVSAILDAANWNWGDIVSAATALRAALTDRGTA